jgi:hypothetical protein
MRWVILAACHRHVGCPHGVLTYRHHPVGVRLPIPGSVHEINMGMKQNQQKMVIGLWKPETKPCKLGFKPESSSKLES